MKISRKLILAPALVLAAACSSKKDDSKVDDALKNDLALAASAQPYQPQQYMSPLEQGYAQGYGYPAMGQQYAPRPVYASPARCSGRSSTARPRPPARPRRARTPPRPPGASRSTPGVTPRSAPPRAR